MRALEGAEAREVGGQRREPVVREVELAQLGEVGEREERRRRHRVVREVEHLEPREAAGRAREVGEAVAVEVELLQRRQVREALELHGVVAEVEVREPREEGEVLAHHRRDRAALEHRALRVRLDDRRRHDGVAAEEDDAPRLLWRVEPVWQALGGEGAAAMPAYERCFQGF